MKPLLLTIALLFSTPAWADNFVCNVKVKKACDAKGCNSAEILDDDFRLINEQSDTIMIGSDKAEIKSQYQAGIFKIYEMGSGSAFIKIAMTDVPLLNLKSGDFLEQRDLMLGSILSWGKCK